MRISENGPYHYPHCHRHRRLHPIGWIHVFRFSIFLPFRRHITHILLAILLENAINELSTLTRRWRRRQLRERWTLEHYVIIEKVAHKRFDNRNKNSKWNSNPPHAATYSLHIYTLLFCFILFHFITSYLNYILIRIFLHFLLLSRLHPLVCAASVLCALRILPYSGGVLSVEDSTSTTSPNGNKFSQWMSMEFGVRCALGNRRHETEPSTSGWRTASRIIMNEH